MERTMRPESIRFGASRVLPYAQHEEHRTKGGMGTTKMSGKGAGPLGRTRIAQRPEQTWDAMGCAKDAGSF
jgi:hypothetical protein